MDKNTYEIKETTKAMLKASKIIMELKELEVIRPYDNRLYEAQQLIERGHSEIKSEIYQKAANMQDMTD